MGTRSVRLDDEAEKALDEIINVTGISISDAIKRGLIEYRDKALAAANKKPADFFENFDLGDGNYAIGEARDAKYLLKEKLLEKRKPK